MYLRNQELMFYKEPEECYFCPLLHLSDENNRQQRRPILGTTRAPPPIIFKKDGKTLINRASRMSKSTYVTLSVWLEAVFCATYKKYRESKIVGNMKITMMSVNNKSCFC